MKYRAFFVSINCIPHTFRTSLLITELSLSITPFDAWTLAVFAWRWDTRQSTPQFVDPPDAPWSGAANQSTKVLEEQWHPGAPPLYWRRVQCQGPNPGLEKCLLPKLSQGKFQKGKGNSGNLLSITLYYI